MPAIAPPTLTRRLIDTLYTEAMILADEARSYFDRYGRDERDALSSLDRVAFSCESLRVTTRLMHVIAWLLTQRAVAVGEIRPDQARTRDRRLGVGQDSDPAVIASLPETAQRLIYATVDLHSRVARLDGGLDRFEPNASPARGLFARLESAF